MESKSLTRAEVEFVVGQHPFLLSRISTVSESLVRRDLSGALAHLEEFGRAIRRHADTEEASVLPVYRGLSGISRAGRVEYFIEEHRRIDAQFDFLITELRGLSAQTATDAAIVALVEGMGRLRSLMSHHFQREEKTLYPRLLEEFA